VVDDPTSAKVASDEITPGEIEAEVFKPSSYYASSEGVTYTIHLRPEHGLTPESRIIIDMPDLLTFDRAEGCQVVLTICDCAIDPVKNVLTLTNIFQTNLQGGNLIKFLILKAKNPVGSRETGPWAVRTETPVDSVFFVVDGRTYSESFFARAGQIFSTLAVNDQQVSSSATIFNFIIKTEHDIPRKGKIIVTFPEETFLSNEITLVNFSDYKQQGNTLTIAVEDGLPKLPAAHQFQVIKPKNNRSFAPSGAFYVATTD